MIIYYLNIYWLLSFLWTFIYTSKSLFQSQSIYSLKKKTSIFPLYLPSVLCRYSSPLSLLSCFFSCIFNCDAHFFASALQPFLIRWHLHKYLQLRCSCFLFLRFCLFCLHFYVSYLLGFFVHFIQRILSEEGVRIFCTFLCKNIKVFSF